MGGKKTFWDAIPQVNIRGKLVARLSSGTTSSSQNTPMIFTARIVVISSNSSFTSVHGGVLQMGALLSKAHFE